MVRAGRGRGQGRFDVREGVTEQVVRTAAAGFEVRWYYGPGLRSTGSCACRAVHDSFHDQQARAESCASLAYAVRHLMVSPFRTAVVDR
jgi:hypothetical protein